MIKLILLWLVAGLLMSIFSCKKQNACEVGDTCLVKKHIFNDGAYQPHSSLKALKINKKYTELWGKTYLDCSDSRDTIWNFPQEDLYKVGE